MPGSIPDLFTVNVTGAELQEFGLFTATLFVIMVVYKLINRQRIIWW